MAERGGGCHLIVDARGSAGTLLLAAWYWTKVLSLWTEGLIVTTVLQC